jgi:hypothetical protein
MENIQYIVVSICLMALIGGGLKLIVDILKDWRKKQ